MKLTLAILLALTSLTSLASTLAEDLARKDCAIEIKKTITIKKKSAVAEVGDVSLFSLFHNSNLKLKSGNLYPIHDVSNGTLAISQGTQLILVCINDGDDCLNDLTTLKTPELFELSNKSLAIKCQ